jgi:diacylglycerol O-acyltransferase
MSGEQLPNADAAWLHMDRDTNPMVVNSVIWFDAPLDWERVKEVVQLRLLGPFPRFSRRIAEPLGRPPRFEDDPEFDLDRHMHRRALPAPGDQGTLRELVSDLITSPLDHTLPLWQCYLIEGFGGGCAVLFRIHHCIADGIALGRVLLSLTDDDPEAGPAPAFAPAAPHGSGGLAGVLGPALSATRKVAGAVVHEGMETIVHPQHIAGIAGAAARDAGTLAKLLGSPADTPTTFKRPLHGTRRVAWSEPFPLQRVKRAGRRAGCTINDMLVAAVTGALRSSLLELGDAPEELHIMVPFNLRPLDQPLPRTLGNDFSLILLGLPLGIEDRARRLQEVKWRMDAIKRSHEGPISYGILSALGRTPPAVEDLMIGFFTDKASAVVTNVPGPREQVYLAGTPVRGVLVWAPCSGSIGMTVSIFSYAGKVTVGFMTDTALIADPQPLVAAFEAELRALTRAPRRAKAAHA